jgi:hypothetical protein
MQEYDVVMFSTTESSNSTVAVGCITELSEEEGVLTIQQLIPDDETESTPNCTTWVELGCEHVVPVDSVLRVLEASFSQRMDTDRVTNPHGEHAHSVWEINEDVDLSQQKPLNSGDAVQ